MSKDKNMTFVRGLVFVGVYLVNSSVGHLVTANGKNASASSLYSDISGPEMADDGDTVAVYPGVFHSAISAPSAWWAVDLGEEVVSPQVTIYFRTEHTGRRDGVRISLSTVEGGTTDFCHVVTSGTGGIADIYDFTCDTRGRYLNISSLRDTNGQGGVLDFGEVEVHACSMYTFGQNCSSVCHCAEEPCDWRLHTCSTGCVPGWTKSACDTWELSADVSIFTKHSDLCDVPVSYSFEAVALMSVIEMENSILESRMECSHKCEALALCVSFEYTTPTCTMWREGNSGLSGSRDMWKRRA